MQDNGIESAVTSTLMPFVDSRIESRDSVNQRRQVLLGLACTATGAPLGAKNVLSFSPYPSQRHFKSARPAPPQRKCVSYAVEAKVVEVKRPIADPKVDW